MVGRRPAKALSPSEDELRVTDVKDGPAMSTRLQQPQTIALFLETPVPPSTELPPINKSVILLFLKFYNPKTQTLRVRAAPTLAPPDWHLPCRWLRVSVILMRPCGPWWMLASLATLALVFQVSRLSTSVWVQYIGRIFATKTQRFVDLMPLLLKRAGLPEGTKLCIYEEIKFDPSVMVDLQTPSHSLANAQLEDGDILCLQEEPTEVRPADFDLIHLLFWIS